MPRKALEPELRLETLSIVDAQGKADKKLDPDLPEELLLDAFSTMLLARRFDERMIKLQRQGRIGTFAPVKGQEAAQVGAVSAIGEEDWLVPSYRATAAMLWRGTPLTGILLFNAGYNEGGRIPDEQRDLPIAIPVGTQTLHCAGIGYGIKYRGNDEVVLTDFGDGATSQGDFHEALNYASVFGTPSIFVCQNNQWAISVPRERQSRAKSLAQKAVAYGMPGIQVDGNDLLAVHLATKEAADRARAGDGPTLIECVTYRMEMHTTADDPSRYRSEDEVKEWAERDPIARLQTYLSNRKMLNKKKVSEIEAEVDERVDRAWKDTESIIADLPGPEVMFDHVYAERPAYLEEQRARFAAESGSEEA